MPITRISYKGQSWPIDEFVAACMDGSCNFPAPVAATILENHRDYDNRGTVSGSQLHKECDFSSLLERLPYTKEISDMFWATYRGSNVHAMIEKCKNNPEFKDWIFEKRFFAVMNPDDSIDRLDVPLKKNGDEDWQRFRTICDLLIVSGCIILSGQVDTFHVKRKILDDWKTARSVGDFTTVKQSWQQQMNQYSLVLLLNGYEVKRIRITVMDASMPVVLEVPVPDLEAWAGMYLVPRVRYLADLQKITVEEIQAVVDGKPAPAYFPPPKVNYLCNGKNKTEHIYCPFRDNGMCPAWREPDLTAQLEESLRRIDSKSEKRIQKADATWAGGNEEWV